MSYQQWAIHKNNSRRKKQEIGDLVSKVDRISNHRDTIVRYIDDFPEILNYLSDKFSKVNLSEVKIYIATPYVIEKYGWAGIGGCYVPCLDVILVKNEIKYTSKPRSKFDQVMRQECNLNVAIEDVIVHELVHAISTKINRASSKFPHMEEEFVYTNCIDFYKNKGMSEQDIVNNNFLPFFINDVLTHEMPSILKAANLSASKVKKMLLDEYKLFLSKHAMLIVSLVKEKAQEKAHTMIELYRKYGAMYKTSTIEPVKDLSSFRFSTLDLK